MRAHTHAIPSMTVELCFCAWAYGLLFTGPQTPPKFDWSIEEMASLLPVHIDPEEIQRQSLYLSQTRYLLGGGPSGASMAGRLQERQLTLVFSDNCRMDSDIEEKRQNAIEQV